jgi:hypothetical protein
MIGRIGTLIGYSKAPKATFMLKHPIKGTKAYIAARRARRLSGRTGLVLGAIAAVPVGMWAFSKFNGDE